MAPKRQITLGGFKADPIFAGLPERTYIVYAQDRSEAEWKAKAIYLKEVEKALRSKAYSETEEPITDLKALGVTVNHF